MFSSLLHFVSTFRLAAYRDGTFVVDWYTHQITRLRDKMAKAELKLATAATAAHSRISDEESQLAALIAEETAKLEAFKTKETAKLQRYAQSSARAQAIRRKIDDFMGPTDGQAAA